MRLSNTLMMNSAVLPEGKKAFTLAEVLITLSILGVVAALTIPSLVNRQSDLAAQVKLKKAISNYEDVIGIYMAEKEKASAKNFVASCADLTGYFKTVDTPAAISGGTDCQFTTADGVAWRMDITTGNATVTDNAKNNAGRYGVVLWNRNNRVNANGSADNVKNIVEDELVTALYNNNTLIDTNRTAIDAVTFLQGQTLYCGTGKVVGVNANDEAYCK